MSSEDVIKIICIGPKRSGKTVISNLISNYHKASGHGIKLPYSETIGVRICELVPENEDLQDYKVEIWDVSGDKKFSTCWNAIIQDVSGIVYVYNPERSQSDKALLFWHKTFFKATKLKENCCIIFSHYPKKATFKNVHNVPDQMRKILTVCTNIEAERDSGRIMKSFSVFLKNVEEEKRKREEESFLDD